MRILAVRGHNLASLADPFEVDFTAEPLVGTGLFAITGETGAGKSTLLDALCLALYGDFPRIAEGADQDVPDVAEHTLKTRDARSILRRNSTSGHAEVDFVGADGAVYRAHWEVNRARGRAGGRLQDARRSLVRLDASGAPVETLAEKTTAVTARVVELTDLTFEQFRRTVVLAQGEFDFFLRAADSERADLLEKITGTAIYARLSAAAFDRRKTAAETVARARDRRAALGLLAPEVRAEKEARRAVLGNDLDLRRRELDLVATRLAALERLDRARERAQIADAAARAAAEAFAAAAPDRVRFAAIDRARSLRPVVKAQKDAHRAEAEAVEALAEADARLNTATPRYRDAGEARKAAEAARDALDARIDAHRPVWDAAARLDVRIGEAERRVAEAAPPARIAATAVADKRAEGVRIDQRRAEVLARLARLRSEIDRHPQLAPLAERWEEIADRLADRQRRRGETEAARVRRASAETEAAEAARRLDALDAAATDRTERRATLAADLERTRLRLLELREEETRTRDELASHLAARLGEAAPLAREHAAATAATTRAEAEAREARTALAGIVGETARIAEERDTLLALLAEGAAADRLAVAVETAVAHDLRDALVEGAPCPVCGATDHPILADPTIRAALTELRERRTAREARRRELDDALAGAERRRASEETRAASAGTAVTESRARADAAEAALAALDTDAVALAAALGLDWTGLATSPVDRLAAAPSALAALRAPLAERLDAARAARGEIDALRDAIDRLDREAEAERARRGADAATLARAERERAVAEEAERQADERRADIDRALAPHLAPLSIGPVELDRDGVSIAERLGLAVADRRAVIVEMAEATGEEQDLERAALRIDADLAHLERTRVATETTLTDLGTALEALRAERAPLLDGEATDAHRNRIEVERAAAAAALDAAIAFHTAAASEHDTALTQTVERRKRLQQAQGATSRAGTDCEHALAAVDLDWSRAAALLAVSDADFEALRERLATVAETQTSTATEAAARRRDLDAAAAETEGAPSRDALLVEADRIRTTLDSLNRELGALDQGLAADDAALTRAVEIDREIADLEADFAVWAAVGDAIGSADGGRFRRFAQGVTLDRLAALADRHLATLAPRYRLKRTDGLGLAIVDRDMGDELRSTRSLSGGERFLASLALALALSGLEGRRSFVDTLFIDEGFGSLDAATLDVAIDALESLQSEGRKVGVISHVAALHDRIPVQIRVRRIGGGVSRIRVVDDARA